MTREELEDLRAKIEKCLANLAQSTDEIKIQVRGSGDDAATANSDVLDAAKGETDLKTQVEIHNHAVNRQAVLKNALARMANGTFGVCQECGCEIATRRLEAQPCATLCIHCQKANEGYCEPMPRQMFYVPRMLGSDYGQVKKAA